MWKIGFFNIQCLDNLLFGKNFKVAPYFIPNAKINCRWNLKELLIRDDVYTRFDVFSLFISLASFYIKVFFGGVLRWVFVAAHGLSLVVASRGYSSLGWVGFSCCGAQALGARASVVVARGLSSCGSWALERRLSSCGAHAQLLHGMWDPPKPGLAPVSPALAGGLLTTVPSGKPYIKF